MLIENQVVAQQVARRIDELIAKSKDDLANIAPLGNVTSDKEPNLTWFLRGSIKGLEAFKKELLANNKDE